MIDRTSAALLLSQAFGLLTRVVFAVHLIATSEQPIDVIQTPSAGVEAHNRATALVLHPTARSRSAASIKRLQGAGQLCLAIEEAIHDDFLIATGQHATKLSSTTIALLGKVALDGKGGLGSTGQATHIHIENLQVGLRVMLIALTVLGIDAVQRLFHLLNILRCTGIQGVLHHRLLGTATAPEGLLQGQYRLASAY